MNPSTDNGSVDYDKISRIYDTSRVTNAETTEKLIRLLQISNDSVLLDMGCGTGNYTYALRRVAKSIVGIDSSIGMLEQARAKFTDLLLVSGDLTSMPFKPESFDAVFAVQVLHHVKEKELFLTEAYRVLRKGAGIAIHACSHRQMRAFWFYHYFPKGLQVDLARMPDSKEIVSLLTKVGFSNIGVEICYHDVVVANETPERYLDRNYRDSISTFAFLSEEDVELGCEKIRENIASGAVENVVQQSEVKVRNDVGGSCIIYGRKT
jgi:ubiquinone/menaquinone biosynthesis C-methylase UbiE